MLEAVQKRWWAQSIANLISKTDMGAVQQKCLAYDIFHGNKYWQCVLKFLFLFGNFS
jgi:hypothetical protein